MKKFLGIIALLAMFTTTVPANAEPVYGLIYKNATEAGIGFTSTPASRVGEATCTSFFGIVGLGQCSINCAAKAGNIKTISYYDTHTRNILGFKKVTVRAYGQ